jgi:hypothetical protein
LHSFADLKQRKPAMETECELIEKVVIDPKKLDRVDKVVMKKAGPIPAKPNLSKL